MKTTSIDKMSGSYFETNEYIKSVMIATQKHPIKYNSLSSVLVPSQHILNLLSTDSIRQLDSVSQSRPKNGELRWLVPGEGTSFDDYAKCPKAES